jgi:hypothetical protein
MADAQKTARLRFAAALTLYLLWVVALVVLAVVSASRPATKKTATVSAESAAFNSGQDELRRALG